MVMFDGVGKFIQLAVVVDFYLEQEVLMKQFWERNYLF